MLEGTEVKALRTSGAQLKDGYAAVRDGELWLHSIHIPPYAPASRENHDPERPRKLLAPPARARPHRRARQERGLTLVPTRIYFSGSHAKVEIALARGKDLYDKRQALRERETKRDMERARVREARGAARRRDGARLRSSRSCGLPRDQDVRLVHPERQRHDQADVHRSHQHPVAGRHAVVRRLLERARLALLPAPPGLHAAEQDDDQQDRVGELELQRHQRAEAQEPHPRCHRRHRPSAVQRDDRQQVEQVDQEAHVRQGQQERAAGERARQRHRRRPRGCPGSGRPAPPAPPPARCRRATSRRSPRPGTG